MGLYASHSLDCQTAYIAKLHIFSACVTLFLGSYDFLLLHGKPLDGCSLMFWTLPCDPLRQWTLCMVIPWTGFGPYIYSEPVDPAW